ncbi:Protein-L-isoaspartate O-methyltransferase [Chlamydiales bacterium STE3]|nr:Protein-L-isoaspartate O-methyltransferase [Chlamydiales bacterium STE3]
MDTFAKKRFEMVDLIESRGIHNPLILESLKKTLRHYFVPEALADVAYTDSPLPIGDGQTISQPYIVALMIALSGITNESTVLEIGTGSGYAAAVLANIVKKVFTIERIESLGLQAQKRFEKLGISNVEVKIGDGTLGWPEKGPFDAIIVTAAAPIVPETLKAQLKEGGQMIIPVGDVISQHLIRVTKQHNQLSQETLDSVRFVPLIGNEGWQG